VPHFASYWYWVADRKQPTRPEEERLAIRTTAIAVLLATSPASSIPPIAMPHAEGESITLPLGSGVTIAIAQTALSEALAMDKQLRYGLDVQDQSSTELSVYYNLLTSHVSDAVTEHTERPVAQHLNVPVTSTLDFLDQMITLGLEDDLGRFEIETSLAIRTITSEALHQIVLTRT